MQCSPRLLLLSIFKTCVIWENIQTKTSLRIHSHNDIQMFIEVVLQCRFHERNGGKCSFILHQPQHLYYGNFYHFEKLGEKMSSNVGSFQSAPKSNEGINMKWCLHSSGNIRFHNDLKNTKLRSRAFANIIVRQILATSKSKLAFEVLTSSKSFIK
jgi:hypothetical protein